jgi:hypothetical protein
MEHLTIEKVSNLIGQMQLKILDLESYVEKLEFKIAELELKSELKQEKN